MEEQPVDSTQSETSPDGQAAPEVQPPESDAPGDPAGATADDFAQADEASQVVVEDVQEEPAPESTATAEGPAAEAPQLDPTAVVEAVLFAADAALTAARIGQVAKLQGVKVAKEAIAQLNERYAQMGCAFRVESIAGGYQMLTLPEYHETLSRLYKARSETKLTGAALETLSIVAYKQPILRADIEAIRGVASGEVLRGLMERQLVKIVGRAEIVGRPMLYGTSKKFLETFGLAGLEDLPKAQELRNLWNEPAKPAAAPAEPAPQEPAQQPPATEPAPTEPSPAPTEGTAPAETAQSETESAPTSAPIEGGQ